MQELADAIPDPPPEEKRGSGSSNSSAGVSVNPRLEKVPSQTENNPSPPAYVNPYKRESPAEVKQTKPSTPKVDMLSRS